MKKILCLITIALMGVVAFAQTVTLTFTGRDADNHWIQLNRVAVTNLTKSWQETIYWPDTTLTMQNGTGIDESVANGGFALSQNNPNPFTGTTDVNLTVADAGAMTLEIVDGNGKIVGTHRVRLGIGTHKFRVSLSTAGTYVMTARQNGQVSSIKMVCNDGGNANGIDYLGMVQTITYVLKSTTNNPFNFGDMMEYVGYATFNGTEVESQRITQAQGASQTFALVFAAVHHTIPTVTTNPITNIGATSATAGGRVISDGGETVAARGVCWSTSHNPTTSGSHTTNGSGTGSFTSNLTGLTAGTTYYVRAYATNSAGTAYGSEESFTTTFPCGISTLTDIDGNTYNTVQIGTQCWMKENLRTTKYANGAIISQGNTISTSTAYWYYPDSSSSNMAIYGLLYNWKAVMRISSSSSANPSGVQGICPTGWHVPSDAEWTQMEMAVGLSQSDTGAFCRGDIAARLCGNTGWTFSSNANAAGNTSATGRNSSGFSALPADAYPYMSNGFGNRAYFWSATDYSSTGAYYRALTYNRACVWHGNNEDKRCGFSVRCVKD